MTPLFVLDLDIQKSLFIVDWLVEKCQEQDASYVNTIKIRSLNKLVYELRRHVDLNNPRFKFTSPFNVTEYLLNSSFTCYENMACKVLFNITFVIHYTKFESLSQIVAR